MPIARATFAALLATSLPLAQAASIDLAQASDTQVIATVVPDESEIGSPANIWFGAVYGTHLFMRSSGNNWSLNDNGFPVTFSGLPLGPVNSFSVVSNTRIASLPGLDIYMAYGQDINGAAHTPGHLAKVYTVPADSAAGLPAMPDVNHLPLGDGKTSTTGAARGQVFQCATTAGDDNAATSGPWISAPTGTYSVVTKSTVQGRVAWTPSYSMTLNGTDRLIASNGLPSHATGVFPIDSADPASAFDTNANKIAAQTLRLTLPADPVANTTPTCLGSGPIGILISGAPLYAPLDEDGHDALARDALDRCQGHPDANGSYHYHSVSVCIRDKAQPTDHSPLMGYAKDGFGIYGRYGEGGKRLSNADLDECHGHTHEIDWNGKKVVMYHYHATWEFPYAIGCYRGTPANQPAG